MRRAGRDERGSASIFVLGMSIVLMVCAGLVVDGGLAINARMRVADDAEQASRVGADSINLDILRAGGGIVIDPDLAAQRSADYLNGRGYTPGQYSLDIEGETVSVTVRDTTDTMILGLVGIETYDVGAAASATPETEQDPAGP